jgi:acetyl-CoA acyltransferase
VAIAATTQIGDQGLTLGRRPALLAGLPKTTPGYSVDRMCAGAMTAVTTLRRSDRLRRHRRRHRRRRRAHGPPPHGRGRGPQPADRRRPNRRPVGAGDGQDRREPARPLPAADQGAADAFAVGSQDKLAAAYAAGKIQPDLVPVATRSAEQGWGLDVSTSRRGPAPPSRTSAPQDPLPSPRSGHRRQCGRPQRRRDRLLAGRRGHRRRAGAAQARCAWSPSPSSAWSPRSWASARSPLRRRRCARPA